MTKLLMIVSMLFALGSVAPGVAAQVDAIEGLQSAYERLYGYDLQMLVEAKDEETGEYPTEMFLSSTRVSGYTFESDDQASAFLEFMVSQLNAAIESDAEGFGGLELSEWEDFELSGTRITSQPEEADEFVTSQTLFAIDNHVFDVQVRAVDLETAEARANDFIEFIANAEVQSDEVVLAQDGTSTGGVFDRMPTVDDEVIGDFTNIGDREIDLFGN